MTCLRSGCVVAQVRFYTAGLNLAPDNHLLRYSRANALVKLGKTTDATRDALLLVRVMPVWCGSYAYSRKATKIRDNPLSDAKCRVRMWRGLLTRAPHHSGRTDGVFAHRSWRCALLVTH